MPLHITTPLLESLSLRRSSGRSTFVKLEAVQPSGSFKIRGLGLACEEFARAGATRFISSSGGNAGIAAAYAGRKLGIPTTVIVPETTTEHARNKIRLEGATVMVHGASWQEANAFAHSMLQTTDAFIHPFDHPVIWRGHSTIVDEIAQAIQRPDAIVVAVGGGGLLSGVAEGMERNGWRDVLIVAVETAGADSLSASIKAGSRVELPKISSIATTLGAKKVAERAFEVATKFNLRSVVVSDAEAIASCHNFLREHNILVEPACGAALAVAYSNHPILEGLSNVVCIACGGVTMSLEQLLSLT